MSPIGLERTESKTKPKKATSFGESHGTPGLLIAFAPPGSVSVDRLGISSPFIAGRDPNSNLCIADNLISRNHLRITASEDDFLLEDLGSSNGTFVSGYRVTKRQGILNSEVIRLGDTILVFKSNLDALTPSSEEQETEFIGKFYSERIHHDLQTALLTGQPLLISGQSGTGKELLVNGLVSLLKKTKKKLPFVSHNMARFASEAEIVSTLFGVAAGVFSGVDSRKGLIEEADGGVLFLDEVHNLPIRVQRSLLKIVEDRVFSRIGETTRRQVEIRFVLASNAEEKDHGLAPDLLARLHVLKVPSLKERVADIPCIFNYLMDRALRKFNLDGACIENLLTGDHYEALCLDGFAGDNVRGMDNFVNKLVAKIAAGEPPRTSIANAFSERFGNGPVAQRIRKKSAEKSENTTDSHYEENKEIIIDTYMKCQGNITTTQQALKDRGISCSRRWLSVFLDRWEIRKINYRSGQ